MNMSRLASSLTVTLAATLLLACACGGKSAPATPAGSDGSGGTSGTGGTGGPTADDVPPGTIDLSKLGADCGEADRCEAGACTKYYGIAGASGPEFASCEITCVAGKGCPAGTACITIADGPGQVCRPADPDRVEP